MKQNKKSIFLSLILISLAMSGPSLCMGSQQHSKQGLIFTYLNFIKKWGKEQLTSTAVVFFFTTGIVSLYAYDTSKNYDAEVVAYNRIFRVNEILKKYVRYAETLDKTARIEIGLDIGGIYYNNALIWSSSEETGFVN
jgi:hypothetical protein